MARADARPTSPVSGARLHGAPAPARHLDTRHILEAARRLLPEIEARADEAAALRRMPINLVAKLQDAGIFRMTLPRARGGPEMSPREQVELIELLSTADPSIGWCVCAGAAGGFLSARLMDTAAHELFPSLDTIAAGDLRVRGHAERVRGGYRVTGRWGFASGCTHAAVIYSQCEVVASSSRRHRRNALREIRTVIAPAGSWQILDTWYTTGLAGTGSHDFTAQDLYVPQEHTISLLDAPRRPEALYATNALIPAAFSGVPLGLARRAIDALRALVDPNGAEPASPARAVSPAPNVRAALAHAESVLGATRAYTYQTLDAVWARLESGAELTNELQLALRLSSMHAFRAGREVAHLMFNTAGAAAVYSRSPLDRLLRDAITLANHAATQEGYAEMLGGALLGEDAPSALL